MVDIISDSDPIAHRSFDVWSVFYYMNRGCKVFRIPVTSGPLLWLAHHRSATDYREIDVIQPLIESGLVEENAIDEETLVVHHRDFDR